MNKKKLMGNLFQVNNWNVRNLGNTNIAIIDANVVIEGYETDNLVEKGYLPLIPKATLIEVGGFSGGILPITSSVDDKNLNEAYHFYQDPAKKQRLQEITESKIYCTTNNSSFSFEEVKEFIENKRKDGYFPEEGDCQLLAHCLAAKEAFAGDLMIVTKDRDFTMFSEELKDNYGISVVNPEQMLAVA
jgi:hypothetical protein